MKITLFLLTAGACLGQPTISNIRAYPSHNALTVRADITGATLTDLKFFYGTTSSTTAVSSGVASGGGANGCTSDTPTWMAFNTPEFPGEYTFHSCPVAVPVASTLYYFKIVAYWSGGSVTSSCTNGQTGTGWACQAGGGIHTTTTTANGTAPAFHEVRAYTTHGTILTRAIVTDFTGIASVYKLSVGTTTGLGRTQLGYPNNDTYAAMRTEITLHISGLVAGTAYYFKLTAQTASDTVDATCTNGSSGTGWTCQSGGGLFIATTAALPADRTPTLPTTFSTDMPTVNGSTFAVASDCSDLQTKLQACADADTSLVHKVTIPAGTSCAGPYNLPLKVGSGTCIVRSAAADSALPPEHIRISNDYEPQTARLYLPYTVGSLTALVTTTPGTQGWRLGPGLRFGLDSPTSYRQLTITNVADVSGFCVVTTSGSHGLFDGGPVGSQIYITGVTGFSGRGVNGAWQVGVNWAANQFSPYDTLYSQAGTPSCVGTYAGGGYVIVAVGNAITAATNTSTPVLTVTNKHGLWNEPWSTISSISGNVLTLVGGHFVRATYTNPVEISGSSISAWNGIWNRSAVSGNSLTITGGPGTTCSSSCGQVREKWSLTIDGVVSPTALNGGHLFTVTDDTHVQLDDVPSPGTYSSGGILSMDPRFYYALGSFSSEDDRMVYDRVIFEGAREFPNRLWIGMNLGCDNCAMIDSSMQGIKYWQGVNPKSGAVAYSAHGNVEPTAIFFTTGHTKKIFNNFIETMGIGIYAEQWNEGPNTSLTLQRNTVYSSLADMAGSSTSNGRYYAKRQLFEAKEGDRILIDGNIFDGNWADQVPCGSPLLFTPRANYSHGYISDVTITNNTLKHASSGIQISSNDEVQRPLRYGTHRFKIDNNLMHDIDRRVYLSVPSLTGGGICGYGLAMYGSVEDIQFSHTTGVDIKGNQSQFLSFHGGHSGGVVVRDNIFWHHHDNNAGTLQPAGTVGYDSGAALIPNPSGTIQQVFDAYFPTLSGFYNNLVVPGVYETNLVANYLSTTPGVSYPRTACDTYYSGFTGVTCLGSLSDNDSAGDRGLLVKFLNLGSGTRDFRLRYDAPGISGEKKASDGKNMGVDMTALEVAQGIVRNAHSYDLGTTTAKIGFVSPDACVVEYSTTNTPGTGTRATVAAGTNPAKSTSLTGLTTATTYYWWVHCPSQQPTGSFRTL